MTQSEQYIALSRRSYRQICTGLAFFLLAPFGILGVAVGGAGVMQGDSSRGLLLALGLTFMFLVGVGVGVVRFGLRNGKEAVAILDQFVADSGVVDKSHVLQTAVATGDYRFGTGTVVKDGQEVVAELALEKGNIVLRTAPAMNAAVTL
jgi:hypothetical protein